MSPPGGTNGDGKGSRAAGKVIPLYPKHADPKVSLANELSPDSGRRSDPPLPSATEYQDFSNLRALTDGLGTVYSKGPFARIYTLISLLTNPNFDGSINAELVRQGNHFKIFQESPDKEIKVQYFQEVTSKKGGSPKLKPVFELVYLPDGSVKNYPAFDASGKPVNEVLYPLGKLRRAGEMNHLTTVSFLDERVEVLGKGLKGFIRLSTPLVQLQPTKRDLGSRSNWFENFAVVDGELYSLRTQNLGSAAFDGTPSQYQITLYKHDQSGNFIEVLKISQTGEVNFNPAEGTRRPPTVPQLDILNKLITEIEAAHADPDGYREKLIEKVRALGPDFAETITVPKIAHTSIKLAARPATQGDLGESIIKIENGVDLFRRIRLFWPQYERWVNPTNPSETRYLRPKGSIRRAMAWEWFRWAGNALWHGTVNDVNKIMPKVGHLNLHMFPDGTTELKIYRDTKRVLPSGETHWENGLYNVIRRTADGKTLNLGRVVRRLAAKDPAFANLPRDQQLLEADRKVSGDSELFDLPPLQEVPELPIRQLEVENPSGSKTGGIKGPTSALAAKEAIENLPLVRDSGLITRVNAMVKGSLLAHATGFAPENFFEIQFPGANPETLINISEDTLKTEGNKRRVVIHMWHGDTVASAVYDNGLLNVHESARLNMSEVHRARQGHHRPWFKGWAFFKGTSFVRLSHYFLHGGAYVFGNYASIPIAQGYEKLFWTDAERRAIGTPSPNLSGKALFKEAKNAGLLMTASGFGQVTTEGIFNWGGALRQMYREMGNSGITFGQAWRNHPPRWHNEPPVRFRPIHKQAGILRNFLSRAVPLATGILALEAAHQGWKPLSFSWDNYRSSFSKINYHHFGENVLQIGAISLVSSGFWSWSSHRAELAMAKRLAGQPIKGFGGMLLRRRFLTTASRQVGGARLAMTYKATLLTILLEMAALRIWDSYERKNALVAQEPKLRGDLSSALNHRNEIMSRLENGEAVPPRKIFEAQKEVEGSFQRYRTYLEVLDRKQSSDSPPEIPFQNRYGEAYDSYRLEYAAFAGKGDSSSNALLAQAEFQLQHRIGDLHRQEATKEEKLRQAYVKFGLEDAPPSEEESLEHFLARAIEVDRAAEGGDPAHTVKSPVSVNDEDGKAIVEQLNWKISKDPSFVSWNKTKQAEFIIKEFSGYRVRTPSGSRPWSTQEAMAFLDEVDAENTRRLNHFESPLTSLSGNPESDPEKYQDLALEVERISREGEEDNIHSKNIQTLLAANITDLDRQMEHYETEVSARIDHALVQFIPQANPEGRIADSSSNEKPRLLALASTP